MKNFVQAEDNITVPAPATVAAGAGVLVGALFGVANGDAASGEPVVITTRGVFDLAKVETDALAVGAAVYWNATAKAVTIAAGGNTRIGHAVAAAGNPSATARIRLAL